jgi:hypothetical protein
MSYCPGNGRSRLFSPLPEDHRTTRLSRGPHRMVTRVLGDLAEHLPTQKNAWGMPFWPSSIPPVGQHCGAVHTGRFHARKCRGRSTCFCGAETGIRRCGAAGGRKYRLGLRPKLISLGLRRWLQLGLRGIADGLSQHLAQLILGLRRFALRLMPVCHAHYMAMREEDLNPCWWDKCFLLASRASD